MSRLNFPISYGLGVGAVGGMMLLTGKSPDPLSLTFVGVVWIIVGIFANYHG